MAKYEAHITFDKSDKNVAFLKDGYNGWQYSCIDDDPVMGQKPYCYLTAYLPDRYKLMEWMDITTTLVAVKGINSLRTKIEHILYDSKTGLNDMTNPLVTVDLSWGGKGMSPKAEPDGLRTA